MSEWQPIETAPKDGTRILLFDDYERQEGFAVFVGYWGDHPTGSAWVTVPGGYKKRPTHWMLLPEQPR